MIDSIHPYLQYFVFVCFLKHNRKRYENSGNVNDKYVVFKIYLSEYADLNQIAQRRILSVHRRGDKAKLSLMHMLKKKRSYQNVSGNSSRSLLDGQNNTKIRSLGSNKATKKTSPRNDFEAKKSTANPAAKKSKKDTVVSLNGQHGKNITKSRSVGSKATKTTSPMNGSENKKSSTNLEKESNPVAKKPKKDATGWTHFAEKMKYVKFIEFNQFKIPAQMSGGRMWDMHKRLIGDQCDENCKCPSMLGKLTQSVIRHHIQKEQGKGQFKNHFNLRETDSMIGFATRFCGKFYDKVRNQFPKDNHHQTLQRLFAMWEAHQQQMRFGTVCEENCECASSWFELFLPVCEKSFATGGAKEQHSSTLAAYGKKTSNSNIGKGAVPNQTKKTEMSITIKPKKDTIGLHFITNDGKCIISSVQPNGYAVTRCRNIEVGLVVAGISTGNKRHNVNTWKDIETEYKNLKQTNHKMQIWFTNDVVKNFNVSSMDCKKDWSSNGAWIRDSSRSGWAGGASVAKRNRTSEQGNLTKLGRHLTHIDFAEKISKIQKVAKLPPKDSSRPQERIPNKGILNGADVNQRHTQKEQDGKLNDSEVEFPRAILNASSCSARQSGNQPKSILKVNATNASSNTRRVRFRDEQNKDVTPLQSRKARLHQMKEAARLPLQSVINLVQQFRKTPITKDEFVSLKKGMQEVLKELEENKSNSTDQEEYDMNSSNIEALIPKKRALVIFERAGEIIDMIRFIHNPSVLKLTVTETKVKLTSKVGDQNSYSNLYCTLTLNKSNVASTSKLAFKENLDWWNATDSVLSTLYDKSHIDAFYGKDEAKITLIIEDFDGNGTLPLSSATIGIAKIAETADNESHTRVKKSNFHTLKFEKNDLVEEGSLVLIPTKADAPPTKVSQKKEEIVQKMKDLIHWVERFQADYNDTKDLVCCDITSFENVSLLHAAIACCRKDIVEDFLRLGARTDVESKRFGTPMNYARTLVKDMQKIKEKDMKRQFHEIIQLLDRM